MKASDVATMMFERCVQFETAIKSDGTRKRRRSEDADDDADIDRELLCL